MRTYQRRPASPPLTSFCQNSQMETGTAIVIAIAASLALFLSIANSIALTFVLTSRAQNARLRPRIRRVGNSYVVQLRRVGRATPSILDHGMMQLDGRDVAHAGGPLFQDEPPDLSSFRAWFLDKRDSVSAPSTSDPRANVMAMEPDDGAALWVTSKSLGPSRTTESLVILWSSERRRSRKRPMIVRGAIADELRASFDGSRKPPVPQTILRRVLSAIRRWTNGPTNKNVEEPHVFYSTLNVEGLRGFGDTQCLELALPDGRTGSGLTIIVGANNSGKSSVVEAFDAVYRATRHSSVSFAADRRHGGSEREVRILFTRIDGRSVGVESLRAGTSEARVLWDNDPTSDDRFPLEVSVLPSRRQFAAYFGKYGNADRGWASSNSNEFSRSQNRDTFVARLFALHEDEQRLATFNELLRRVTGRTLTWSIDLGAQQQYFLRFSEPGGGVHTSDGLGDGLISLLFILDALHDSDQSSTIVIDEPELSLHPQYVARLGRLLAEYSANRQIIYATHSPTLVNWSDIANGARVARIYKHGGESRIAQPSVLTLQQVAHSHLTNTNNPHVFGPEGNEVFFQEDGLLVLEGQEDVIHLPTVLRSTETHIGGAVFGWGAGGASQVSRLLRLFKELGFARVAVLLDGDEATLRIKNKLTTDFPGFQIESHPAADIRTKKAESARPRKEGLLTDDALSVRPEYMSRTRDVVNRINAYLATT